MQGIGATPIPENVGEMLHVDIFFVEKQKYLTIIDKFSKFLQILHLRSNTEIPRLIEQILTNYPNCSNVTTDNESVFTSQMVNSLLRSYNITHHTTPIGHSVTNGPVERVHSTLLEISRALAEQSGETISEVIYRAVREYNNSIHSVTKEKPVDLHFRSNEFPRTKEFLEKAQDQTLRLQNKVRTNKVFNPGDTIYVKTDRRKKSEPRYRKHVVKEDNPHTIVTTKNKTIHKDHIRK